VPFTVVARSDGEPVGVACGAQSGDLVELISRWVAPSQRGTYLAGKFGGQAVSISAPHPVTAEFFAMPVDDRRRADPFWADRRGHMPAGRIGQ